MSDDILYTNKEMLQACRNAEVGLSYSNALVILQRILDAKPRIEPFRSCGFANKDCDMARISINLPIVEAKKLMAALKAI